MSRALLIATLLLAAAPAAARGDITAGPVIAGDGAAWADRTPAGAARVLGLRPGGRPAVVRRWAPPRDGDSDRTLSSLAAGPAGLAAVLTTCTPERELIGYRCAGQVFAGPFARLRGPRALDRVDRGCTRGQRAEEVAADGGWRAILVAGWCPFRYAGIAAARRVIEARRGELRRTIPLRTGYELRLAGRHLAWRDGQGRAVLFDLRRGERVRRVGSARGRLGSVDVQADGTLALIRFHPRNRVCVAVLPRGGAERTLGCWSEAGSATGAQAGGGSGGGGGVAPEIAISAGRVLYTQEAIVGMQSTGRRLVLQRPGGEPEVIARFPPDRARVGGIDLGPHGATWAQQRQRIPDVDGMPGQPEPVGRPQVVLRPL